MHNTTDHTLKSCQDKELYAGWSKQHSKHLEGPKHVRARVTLSPTLSAPASDADPEDLASLKQFATLDVQDILDQAELVSINCVSCSSV